MRTNHRLSRISLSVAGLVLLSALPAQAQSMPVPCSAFTRSADGGWTVAAPVMLYIDGRPLGPMVGSRLPAGPMPNGINLSKTLNRECGNNEIWPVASRERG